MDKEVVADLLAVASGIHARAAILTLNRDKQRDACVQLNLYGILSLSAIGSIVGISKYRVETAIGKMKRPRARGHLNPRHLPWLGYMLSSGKVNDYWLNEMLNNGTSLSTIADLTGISESTLNRRKRE